MFTACRPTAMASTVARATITRMTAAVTCAAAVLAWVPAAAGQDVGPLVLAENGQTKYRIVIGKDATYGEELAADELAFFLEQITGAGFPIERDDEPESRFEIVLGDTTRKSMEDIPDDLRTDNWEGFALVREEAKLYIMGNLPRATLYGVYDFLDVELGVRFLTAEANHVPRKPRLRVVMTSRTYGPPIERRTIWAGLGGQTVMRNRMNGSSFAFLGEELGGVKWVGKPTHTFDNLVPMDTYFDEHPEYYSLIDGKRYRQYKGMITQLCLTNPDVLRIATQTARGWLGPEVKDRPQTRHVVSVTVNDSPRFCKCGPCVAVNKEEGVEEGGTKMRFVNAIARTLDKEYGNVKVETMIYNTSLPKKTRPAPNVLIQLVHDPDWRYGLDDDTHEGNRKLLAEFRRLQEAIGDASLYNWVKLGTYGSTSFLDPRPNLRYIARNIRVMNECGVRGFFCQTVQTRGGHMQDLRYYLLARAMWRPQIDSRETIAEFCRLYYGPAGDDVLRHINFLHDEYAFGDRAKITMADTTAPYDDTFVTRSDATLAEAESKAPTPEIKQRVATCRLPIWKLKLDRAFGEAGKVYAFPEQWSFKIDPDDVGLTEAWQNLTSTDGWRKMRIDKHWTMQGEEHRGAAWYGTQFDLPDRKDAPLALWFGAIDGDADIFIDGVKVGEQKLPATSMWQHGFFIPLPGNLAPGEHRIAVRVFKSHHAAGIWKEVSIIDMSTPISRDLRTAGERFLEVARAVDLSFISESYGGKYTQTEKMYFPKVRYFLRHGMPPDRLDPWVTDDAGMERISDRTEVGGLNLSGSNVTDEGLRHLRGSGALKSLDLRFTEVTDEGLEHVGGLGNLQRLDLWRTVIGNAGLEHLAGLTNLQELNLAATKVDDDGLKHLKGMSKLEILNLSRTSVTDTGLEQLKGLANLRIIYADDTPIIDSRTQRPRAGAVELMAAVPNLQVRRR